MRKKYINKLTSFIAMQDIGIYIRDYDENFYRIETIDEILGIRKTKNKKKPDQQFWIRIKKI